MSEGIIVIRKGREKPIVQQHPWIFSGAIEAARGDPAPGDIVTVTDYNGAFLARGYWNPRSQIQVRILTWQDEPITRDWWRKMLRRAIKGRDRYTYLHTRDTALRLVNAENDFLPGLVIDRYGDWLVLQALTLGIECRKGLLAELLMELIAPAGIYERSDVDVRGKEGLSASSGVLAGQPPASPLAIIENDFTLRVDIVNGHKTGYYLDQRANRTVLKEVCLEKAASDTQLQQLRVLNLFSYTGGFGLYALGGGAEWVVNVDASRDALELAEANFELNRFPPNRAEFIQADVFDYLRDQAAEGALYDVIVCDPPKFAHNTGQVERAARGYKDLNLNCFRLVKPGGYLMTFSCSGAISADLFQKIIFGALADSRRQAQIIQHLTQAEDHPVALTFPEGAYLKGLLLRVY
ncbi:MAG: class I SAM-dependent rRNA methyltransferase [Chloroflexi bacterium]|nr:class I SAM-dependent rRNA methyltransferase [Chloroflexota bacterium]